MGWKDWLGLAPTRDEFARDLARRAAKRGVPGWTYDPAQSMLTHTEHGGSVHVTNVHLEYTTARAAARPGLIEKYLSLMLDDKPEVPRLWGLAAKNLYGCLRSRYQLTSTEIENRGASPPFVKPVSRPWQGDLDIVLAYDFGNCLAQVLPDTVEAWGQSRDALFARAIANLAALPRPTWQALGDGVFQVVSDVSYEESFVLVDAVCESLPVQGDPVAVLPNRGVLLATGSEMPAGLARLVTEGERSMLENPWPLSAVLLRRTSGQWQPYAPRPEFAPAARRLELLSLAGTYAEQQDALQKHYEKLGVDIYVAKFDVMTARTPGIAQSWCSWAEGVPSLLPKTDVVALGRSDKNTAETTESVLAPWEAVERLCAHYMQRTEDDPPRFRVDVFPEAEWAQLVEASERLR